MASSHFDELDHELAAALMQVPLEELAGLLDTLPENSIESLNRLLAGVNKNLPETALDQAIELDDSYIAPAHLIYLAERIANAMERVERGETVKLAVSMPPRSGKSQLISVFLIVWLLRRDPTVKIGLISHSGHLATTWARAVRRIIEKNGGAYGLELARDAGAAADWETTEGGQVHARSIREPITGLGFKVMILDDLVKDYATAHQAGARNEVWNWWQSTASTRLEPPGLVIAVATRWHQDDFIGRLLSVEYDGDPAEWEVISFPAIAEEHDILGRAPGEFLDLPVLRTLTPVEKAKWWASTEASVGSYAWAALYQQRPAPSTGAVFDTSWWRYWTTRHDLAFYEERDPETGELIPREGVLYIEDFTEFFKFARVLDSWDLNFDNTEGSDYVVGQRWAARWEDRFLLDQRRDRWNFPETLEEFRKWNADGLCSEHLVEKKANGAAMISTLAREFTGIKPTNPTASKEVRARAVTAEIEGGHVYLPHPAEFEWVVLLQDELRDFPSGAHDDQVDTLTQALNELRGAGGGGASVPGRVQKDRLKTGTHAKINRTPGMGGAGGSRPSLQRRLPGR